MNIRCDVLDSPPRVVLTVTSMPTGTSMIRIQRLNSDGTAASVRGADLVAVQGTDAWTTTDWDAPIGRTLTWRATCYTGTLGALGTGTATASTVHSVPSGLVQQAVTEVVGSIAVPGIDLDDDQAWISNPYDPASAMRVTLMDGTDDTTSHDMPVTLSLAGRSTHLPSAVVGIRQLGGKRTIVVRCWTLTEAQQLENLLTSTTALLVRSAQIRHRTGSLYVAVGEVSEQRMWAFVDGQDETTWTLSCDEVDPGKLGILVAPWSYAKSAAYVAAQTGHNPPTYADRLAVFPLYLDSTKGV